MAGQDEQVRERFRVLVLPLLDDVYTLARYLTRDEAEAEDATQECFERALRYFRGFTGDLIRPWLFAILRNVLRSRRPDRFASLDHEDGGRDDAIETIWGEATDPEVDLLRSDEAAHLRRLLGQLPVLQKEVLILKEFNELSYREIAEVTGVPIGTVMSRLARARSALLAAWCELQKKARPQ